MALRHARDTSSYPVWLEVVVVQKDPGWGGLPTAAEAQRLSGTEDVLLGIVAGRAVLAGVLTAAGQRTFVFYTDSAEWITEAARSIEEAIGEGAVRLRSGQDPAWRGYHQLIKAERRSRFGLVVLYLLPFISSAGASGSYGPVWGLVILGAILILGTVALRFRKGAQWYLAHPFLMFSVYVGLMAALLFPTIGLTAHSFLPAGGCLLISVLIGTALTASVWRLQLKYWREQRPPDAVP
jgi:hypothetical protein